MLKTVKIEAKGATTVPLDKLNPFQGSLKTLGKNEYEKLRKVIMELGFSFSVHVWLNKGKYYIIDGHQRVFALKQMAEIEGWKVPPIPVSVVNAKSFKEAKLKVLAGASQYGTVNDKGLVDFITENKIELADLVSSFEFPEIDFGDFGESLLNVKSEDLEIGDDKETATMKSGSDQVRQVQLFFDAEDHQEFMFKVDTLASRYKTENITDTLMACVREAHKAKK